MSESSEPSKSAAVHYAEHSDELRSFLLGVLRDPDLTAEALQATFVKVLEHSHQARPESFKGWLFKVALNEALGLKRRQKRDAKLKDKPVWKPIETDDRPDETILHRETLDRVRQNLKTLPPEQYEVVHLRIFEDLKFAEIAEKLKLPLGTVLTRMRLALKTLQLRLKSEQ